MDTRVGNQVSLELGKIDVQGTVESKGGSDGRDALGDETVEVGVGRALDSEVTAADIIQGLVIDHESNVTVFHHSVCAKDGVVRLDDRCADLGRGIDGELDLGFLSVVNGEALEEKR